MPSERPLRSLIGRFVSADLQAGTITHRGALTGVQSGAELQPIFDERDNRVIEPPAEGLVIATRLAKKLDGNPC